MTGKVTLQRLGNGSERTAVRNLLNTWLAYGWTDRCHAALAIVEAVAASDSGLTPKQAAAKVPSDFLAANNINRAAVADSLRRWSS